MGIANLLTVTRLGLLPVLVATFLWGGRPGYALALLVTAVIETTDVLDGRLARSRHQTSDFGKLADPLADVLAHLTLFLCFLWVGHAHLVAVLLVLYREVVIAYLRTAAARAGLVLAARSSGKAKTVIYAVASFAVLAGLNLSSWWTLPEVAEIVRIVSIGLMWAMSAVAVLSGADYIRSQWPAVHALLGRTEPR